MRRMSPSAFQIKDADDHHIKMPVEVIGYI